MLEGLGFPPFVFQPFIKAHDAWREAMDAAVIAMERQHTDAAPAIHGLCAARKVLVFPICRERYFVA